MTARPERNPESLGLLAAVQLLGAGGSGVVRWPQE